MFWSSVNYKVKLDNGQVTRRHQDHLRRQSTPALILIDGIIVDNPNVERAPNQPRRNPPCNLRCPNRYTT